MGSSDVRWIQRFQSFRKALSRLTAAVELAAQRPLSELEQQGLVQAFEFTHELAWNVLKDFLQDKGFVDIIGSRDATRLAFRNGLIADGDAWMDMVKARNLTSHTHEEEVVAQIAGDICLRFQPAFAALEARLAALLADPA